MKKIRAYFAAHPQLSRLYRNASIIFSGNAVTALFTMLALAVLTRALTLEQFGLYTLVVAYVSLIDRLTSFQTWQALIHYGAQAREHNDTGHLTNLFYFGWLLDAASGLTGYLLALLGSALVPNWFGLGDKAVMFTAVSASVLLVNWISTPTALMRLYDRFYAQALYQKVSSGLTLGAITVLWMAGISSILPYLIAGAICAVIGKLLFVMMAIHEAKKQGIWRRDLIDLGKLLAQTPRLWRFVLATNLDGMVRVVRDIDIFIVNGLLGTATVGLYRIARTLTRAFSQISGPFYQAIYPELARLVSVRNFTDFNRLIRQSSLSLGAVLGMAWLGFLVFGSFILALFFGKEYQSAYGVTVICITAMVVWAFSQPLSPAMMALGKVEPALVIHALTTSLYIGLLVLCIRYFDLIGAGMAYLLFYILWSACIYCALRHYLSKQTIHHRKISHEQ